MKCAVCVIVPRTILNVFFSNCSDDERKQGLSERAVRKPVACNVNMYFYVQFFIVLNNASRYVCVCREMRCKALKTCSLKTRMYSRY